MRPTPDQIGLNSDIIIKAACEEYGLHYDYVMTSKRRTATASAVRQVAAAVMRESLGFSFREVAIRLGMTNHTSALYASRRANRTAVESVKAKLAARHGRKPVATVAEGLNAWDEIVHEYGVAAVKNAIRQMVLKALNEGVTA